MSKILEFITEVIGWLQIVLSPLLIGFIIGAVIYFSKQDTLGLISGITVTSLGLVAGIIFAMRVWKRYREFYVACFRYAGTRQYR